MTTAIQSSYPADEPAVDNERVLGVYGMIFGFLASFMIAIFWSMGAVLKITHNGGTIVQLDLQGIWNVLFWSYPFVAAGSVLLALGAFAMGRAKEAAGIAFLPAGAVTLFYLALIQLR